MADLTTKPIESEFFARCEKLQTVISAHARSGEEARRIPDEVMTAAHQSDLFSVGIPTSAGGHGLGLRALGEMTRILSRGCPATGWTLSFFMLHNWLLGRFPIECRREVFAAGTSPLVPAPLAPTGKLTPCDGGFRLSGHWQWATGVNHSDWVIVHGIVKGEGFSTRFAILPRSEVEVDDVWHTSGMRATGSNDVVIRDAFVPSHRTVDGERFRAPLPANEIPLSPEPFQFYPLTPVLALVAAAPALGAAEAVVEMFSQRMRERVLAYTLGDRQADQPAARVRLADAISTVRAAGAYWRSAIDDFDLACAASSGPAIADRMAARLAAATTVRMAQATISTICNGAGASAYQLDSPLQRMQRDVEVLKGHVIFDWDRCAELAGRIELGAEAAPTDMV